MLERIDDPAGEGKRAFITVYSSGAAVSVTDGMSVVGLGTDTDGSVCIPAALCGVTGFKPTARRISRRGVLPLSSTLDSIGPLAPTVACCAIVNGVLTGNARVDDGLADNAAIAPWPRLFQDCQGKGWDACAIWS